MAGGAIGSLARWFVYAALANFRWAAEFPYATLFVNVSGSFGIGLLAAIPAVVAYNRFSHDVDRIAVRFESFMEEFSNILQRQAHARQG